MLDFHAGYLLGTEISWYCTFFAIEVMSQLPDTTKLCPGIQPGHEISVLGRKVHSLGLLPQFTEKNQLQYLLVAPMAVHRTSRVDKTAALTGLPLDRIIGS
jgi:hypothetical protein